MFANVWEGSRGGEGGKGVVKTRVDISRVWVVLQLALELKKIKHTTQTCILNLRKNKNNIIKMLHTFLWGRGMGL